MNERIGIADVMERRSASRSLAQALSILLSMYALWPVRVATMVTEVIEEEVDSIVDVEASKGRAKAIDQVEGHFDQVVGRLSRELCALWAHRGLNNYEVGEPEE